MNLSARKVWVWVMNIVREESRSFMAVLLQVTLAVLLTVAVTAQISPPSDPALSQQLHQALRLVQQGDQHGAMELTLKLLEQNPKFAPALKLKGMLLEESGQDARAAAAYEEALKFAPDDPDLVNQVQDAGHVEAVQREHPVRLASEEP